MHEMTMEEAEENQLFECIKIIVRRCVNENDELIRDTALVFHDSKAISKGQRKKILTNLKGGFLSEAADYLIESVYRKDTGKENKKWIENLRAAVLDKDFPGDVRMSILLIQLLNGSPVPSVVVCLIYSWSKILELQEEILEIVHSTWPEDQGLSPDSEYWILDLLIKCHNEQKSVKIAQFMSTVKSLILQKFPQEGGTMPVFDSNENERRHQTLSGHNAHESPRSLKDVEICECVKILICKYISGDRDHIRDFAIGFCDCSLISKDERRAIVDFLKNQSVQDAPDFLCGLSMKRFGKSWTEQISKALKYDDFPGDERLKNVLEYLCGQNPILRDIGFLIRSWGQWCDLLPHIQELVNLTWTQNQQIPARNEKWHLLVILKCLVETDVEKVMKFVGDVKQVIEERSGQGEKVHRSSETRHGGEAPTKKQKLSNDGKGAQSTPVSDATDELEGTSSTRHRVADVSNGSKQMNVDPKTFQENDHQLRSQSIDARNIPEAKDAEELKNSHSTDTSEMIEFRVVLAEGSYLPANCSLRLYTNLFGGWEAVILKKNQWGGFFSCLVPILKTKRCFEYKYFYTSSTSGLNFWEQFVFDGDSMSNRVIRIDDWSTEIVFQDVVSFSDEYTKPWRILCRDWFLEHLPSAEHLILRCEENRKKVCDFGKELFLWMNNIRNGWKITRLYSSEHYKPSILEIQKFLVQWLRKNSELAKDGTKFDALRSIISTLALVMAMHHSNMTIHDVDLLLEIFQMLSIHKLSEKDQKLLYEEIVGEYETYAEQAIPQIQDGIISLFRRLTETPFAEFLLALPLYWLIANKGVIGKDIVKTQEQGGLVFKRSALPSANHLRWGGIREKCFRERIQRELINLAPKINEIYQLHPWIIGSLQYMLKAQSLIHLIYNRDVNKIGAKFSLDTVFFQLLSACKTSYSQEVKLTDLASLNEYFVCTYQSLVEQAKGIEDTENQKEEARKNLEIPKNILMSLQAVFSEIAKNTSDSSQTERRNSDVLWCLGMTCQAVELANALCKDDAQENVPDVKKVLMDIRDAIATRIHKCRIDDDQLRYWNSLMTLRWPNEKIQSKWKEVLKNEMTQKISNTWQRKDEEFLNYYAEALEKVQLNEEVESCFSEKAFKCTEDLLAKVGPISKDRGLFSSALRGVFSRFSTPRFIKIFNKLFNRELQKASVNFSHESFDERALHFLLTWPFAPQFFRLFNTKDALSKFSEETKDRIINVAATFDSIVKSLNSGCVLVKHLKMIFDNKEKCLELQHAINTDTSPIDKDQKFLSHIIDHRWGQLQAYENAAENIIGFLSACSKLDESGEIMVNNNALKDKILERGKANDEMLSKVSPELFLSPSNTSQVLYFNLPSEILKRFQAISSIKDSKVFHEVWHQNAMNAKSASPDSGYDLGDGGLWRVGWKEVAHGIWKETHRDLMTLIQDMDAGTLTTETASEWFQRCSGEADEIRREIKVLYCYYEKVLEKNKEAKAPDVPKRAEEAAKQDKNVRKEERGSEAEDVSEDEKSQDDDGDSWKSDDEDSYQSSEVEEEDEDSQSPDSDEEEDEDEDYVPVSNIVLRTRQLCCYFQLEKAKETIDLLLQMRDELQLAGDFSSIERHKTSVENKTSSLDELPDDQDIPFVCKIPQTDVDCLRQFIKERELILWLREKMSDISEVKVMCDLAMISAGETPFEVDIVSCLLSAVMGFAPLIFELGDTAGLEELLKKCKAAWKNRNSDDKLLEKWRDTGRQLAWFQGIENFHGSVEKQSLTLAQEINNRGTYTIKRWNHNGPLTVGDCMNLALPNKSELEKSDTYRLDALCDLQSRLMLIAGEAEMGQTDVANFVNVLNSIQLLAGTFVKLVSAGCMLFNNWSAVISCDDVSSNATNNLNIQIKFDDESQALCGTGSHTELSKLSSILNDSLERWNSQISAKRMEHYFLNEYSIQQMIYLCHELAICKDRLPDQVDTLLAIVASYSSVDRLHELLNEATKVRESEPKMQVEENRNIEVETEDDESSEYSIQVRMNAVHEIARLEEVAERIAKAAVQAEGHENIDKCRDWVLLNEFEEDSVKRLCDEFEKERVSRKQTRSDIDIIEEKNRAVRHLIDKEGFDEDVAKASVQANGIEDVDECLTWALLNQYEVEKISALCENFNEDAGFSHQETEIRVITSILHDRSQNTLREVIDRLQENIRTSGTNTLMDSVNTICAGYHDETRVITLQDSLSIEHLGRFLYLLYNDAEIHPIRRDLMNPLQKGRPNLFVCQEQEVLPSVLRLYMYNEDQPLPTTSEVLVCSEQTSTDEVERFMRRAMCNCGNKGKLLFSLAFADKLSFNVSTATEKIFNQLSQETKRADYQLVILLSKQQHYLTTCFDKYLVEGKWLTAGADIPQYLKKHLKVHGASLRTGAACVDKDNSMVRIVSSARSGVGKSLHVQRQTERLVENLEPLMLPWRRITIRLLERLLDLDYVIERLYRSFDRNSRNFDAMLVHIDLTLAVKKGIDAFAFNLFVLGSIQNSEGKVWKRHPNHLYMLEMTDGGFQEKGRFSPRHILNLLPCVKCYAPKEILENPTAEESQEWLGMDGNEFRLDTFQRPFQYLKLYDEGWRQGNLDSFVYTRPTGTPEECIQVLLKHCCMNNPSWAQLRHFASFLNVQLENCENSIYCDQKITGKELQGLKAFAVRFMIRMSQDFATPSLHISDESSGDFEDSPAEIQEEDLRICQFRRKWEESTHPYLFFNEDRVTMTFINVNISDDGDLLDKNGDIVEPAIISKQLVHGLKLQGVSLDLNFDIFDRKQKLGILCQVLGIQDAFDPDPTYELTTDNILKILAIYMRFRCEIPVIIMGETGCGKTRMVEFMSKLKSGRHHHEIKSMITLKIHGGITVADIHRSVAKAQRIAAENIAEHNLSTILFYDEANTTEAIYAIKEVMCDVTIDGNSFKESQLKLVAACNPYKQLSKEAIRKLEDSGLGYRIRTSDTAHFFGNIPMRTLVYRVIALPPSMQPFVWDFGQLSDEAEQIYIQQMTKKLGRELDLDRETMRLVNAVFSEAQNYMRSRQDECRYVSLRDVERCVITYEWFHSRKDTIYPFIDREVKHRYKRMNRESPDTTENLRTLLQTIGICYHASLDDRIQFRKKISYAFALEGMHVPELMIREEISAAQSVFLQNMKMDDNIAANEALQENVFMMTVCADMRIPLFLIGKPGSSKSLAKTIVGDNMQGNTSRSQLYKNLKQAHILSYQCSALTDAVGIESVFKQCAQLQAKQDLKSYTAVVVLDEIGLAEDSPNMPLKVLHPLLECGSTSNSSLTEFDVTKKVGFVGISNWALDPAKMNRGIFVTRNKPTKDDLKKTAKGIFQNQKSKINENSELLEKLTESYLKIYEGQKVEFFGLRDYYSLIKMIHTVCTASKDARLSSDDVTNAIHRNFSGGKASNFRAFKINIQHLFRELLMSVVPIRKMISDNLREKQSRFLLLLTNQFSAASLLHICMDDFENRAQVVFGSSFPGDHNYTDICRNINRIKVCMETGRTVVLLNMTEIHESLYDALNQHYVTFGGQRYVDLGLGGHRVKCRIADHFRLIVVEQKEVVYSEYPIPLINRLEKHHLDAKSLLSPGQCVAAESLSEWTEKFSKIRDRDFSPRDAFVGYHDDTICSVVLTTNSSELKLYFEVLLESATMDAIFRLPESELGGETEAIQENYLKKQFHDSLVTLLKEELRCEESVPLLEITSFSNILSETDRQQIELELELKNGVMLLSLEQFETEQEYTNKLEEFFRYCLKDETDDSSRILLIQCSRAQSHGQLISCAKYGLLNKLKEFFFAERKAVKKSLVVALLLSTEREGQDQNLRGSLLLQHAHDNRIIYVDELRPTNSDIAPASHFYKKSLCDILRMGAAELENGRQEGSLVNIISLLRDCICEAVAKVKSRFSESKRYFDRVKILSALFSEENETGAHFREILLEKMIQLYVEREEQVYLVGNDWIVGEVCNRESLQEGGTLQKTLWLCLKRHISRLIAFMISFTDRHNNLDLLSEVKISGWKVEMWLKIFKSMPLSWSAIGSAQEFLITVPKHQRSTISCKVPFSFLLHEFFLAQWDILSQQNACYMQKIFFKLFRESQLFEITARATTDAKIRNIMKFYASDLLQCIYIPGSGIAKEMEVVENFIHEFAMKQFMLLRSAPEFTTGDEIAIVFLTYKQQSVYLNLISEVFGACPDLLETTDRWIKEQRKNEEFIVHISAFESMLDLAQTKAEGLNDPAICLEWKNLMARVKRIFKKLINHINNEQKRNEILRKWMPLTLVHLLVEQILPSENRLESFEKYTSIIAPQAKLLWRGSFEKDVRTHENLRIMCNVLKRSYEDVKLKLKVEWEETLCRLCRKRVQDPTFLPCGHFTCGICIRRLLVAAETSRRCPTCVQEVPADYVMRPAVLSVDEEKELGNFRSNCTSFFLEYLRQFCFASLDGTHSMMMMERQVKSLIAEMVVEAPDLKHNELECSAIDLNINSKTAILRTLLNNYPELTKNELNDWITKLGRGHIKTLTTVVIKCFEDQILLDAVAIRGDRMKALDHWEKMLGAAWRNLLVTEEKITKVAILQNVAEIRCCLAEATSCIDDIFKKRDLAYDVTAKADNFVTFVVRICCDDSVDSVLREFIVKTACRKYGSDWFHQLKENAVLENLVPLCLNEASEENKTDRWPLLGKSYTNEKSMLYKTPTTDVPQLMGHVLRPDLPQTRLGRILSLLTWAHSKEEDVKGTIAEILQQHSDSGTMFFKYLIGIHSKFLPALKATQMLTEQQEYTLYQIVTVVVAMVTSRSHMMDGFAHLMTRPSVVADTFLPAMPENPFFSVPAEMRRQGYNMLYKCPNGHVYSIGECTQPVHTAKCADCGATIGGANHRAAAGNVRFDMQDERSQIGYLLQNRGNNVVDAGDRVSKQGAAVMQFILHASMLIGLDNEEQVVLRMVNKRTKAEAQRYLVHQLQINLQTISDALDRNMDDTVLLVHEIILRLLNQREGPTPPDWSTLEKRRQWETMFRERYLLPVFQDLDNVIMNAQDRINSAEDQCSMVLYRLVHEVPPKWRELNITDFQWTDSMLWIYIKHSNSSNLLQYLGDGANVQEGVLRIVLDSSDLHLVKYLEPVLQLQAILIQKYQNETDMNDTEKITFKQFEKDGGHSYRELMDIYIEIWNTVFRKLKAKLSYEKRLREYFIPIDIQSAISMGLPSTRGRGQCAKVLAEYLIDLQNEFLTKCRQVMEGDESIEEAEVSQLFHSHFVCIDKQEDLLPLIHMHTKYDITVDNQGRHHHISYNIDALEKQTRERFVMYKKLISKQTLPMIQYPQDIGIGSNWDKVLANTPQKPLSAKMSQDLDRIVARVTSADVCEGVRTLTHGISFLAKVKTNSKKLLFEFLEKDLLLSASRTAVIPKSVLIEHTLSLYNRLSWHKTVHFASRGLNPYKDALSTTEQVKIMNRDVLKELKEVFEHSDVILLQQRMNEMLIKRPDFNADWSLTDIFPYFEFIGDDGEDDSWYVRLPEEIHFKHIAHLFSLAVNFTSQHA